MAENSGIEWTHHTFNPWIGCTKISPACENCYAEEWNKRYEGGKNWGPHAPRRRTKNWSGPVKWNREAAAKGIRYRVFCASLADVFDNHKSIEQEWRDDLWRLIRETPHLDWLLLTKRPQNITKYLPNDWKLPGIQWGELDCYPNVWLGVTVENQEEAERRIMHLLSVRSVVHFLSCEPLLGPVDLTRVNGIRNNAPFDALKPFGCVMHSHGNCLGDCAYRLQGIDWVITGGESGSHYRSSDPNWFRSLRDQCQAAGVPFLFKQWDGNNQSNIKLKGRELDGVVHDGYPQSK